MNSTQINLRAAEAESKVMEQQPVIRLESLTKRYGSYLATQDVNLDVFEGELVTLLGPSGSGKTTTLMMVAGHQIPDAGRIYIGGQDITRQPPYLRRIGMVFQHYAIFPHMTVAENVAFPLQMRKAGKAEIGQAVNSALQMVRLKGLDERYPNQLSGGQLQRVALARALVFGPSVLLMDEPLSALDKQLRESMQTEIRRIQKDLGVPMLYVTHDQHESLVLSDRVAVFNNGRIIQIGTPTDLYERPNSRFVAEFIGESNLIDGTVLDCVGGICSVNIGGGVTVRSLSEEQYQKGEKVTVGVRPEAISIDGTDRGDGENIAAGVIQQVIFAGSFRRVTVRVGNALSFLISQGNMGNGHGLESGRTVKLAWKWSKTSVMRNREELNA